MGRSEYKKYSEFAAWDMDKGCRGIVNQHSPGKRRLRKRLMRQARRRMMWEWWRRNWGCE